MSMPDNGAGPVDDEGMGNAILSKGLHIAFAYLAVRIDGDMVVHVVALLLDEFLDDPRVFFRDPDESHLVTVSAL